MYFLYFSGIDLLLELLEIPNLKHQSVASVALYKLADKARSLSPVDAGPPSPISQVGLVISSLVIHTCPFSLRVNMDEVYICFNITIYRNNGCFGYM